MKKLIMVFALALMWALSTVAQTSVPPSSQSANTQSTNPTNSLSSSGATSGPWTGCIVSLNGNFYLKIGGRLVQLVSSESLTPHAGHTVTVNGTMSASGSTAGSGISSSTSSASGNTGSNRSSNPPGSNPSAVSPSPAREHMAGTGAAENNANASINVSDVSMVSSTCNDADQTNSSISGQTGSTSAGSSVSPPTAGTSGSYGAMGATTGQSSAGGTASSYDSSGSSLTGCIKSSNGEYWLHTRRGADVKLNSTQDLSTHVGHEVRVSGNWESKATGSSDTSSGSSNPSTSTSGSTAGAYSTDSGSSGKKGSKANIRTFDVTNVEMVAEKCSIDKGSNAPGRDSSTPR